ncbi:MAG: potassium-transporting ATPase subunit KdpC [Clostridium chrysemydis]|uniref:potassium-transporting ATPase subunit KdpC n=1 Tax=Clostridium chrysemydis TaxID=2665504 RepID=UPI003F2DD083
MIRNLIKGIKLTVIMIVLCGILYPLIVTGIGQVLFKDKANGSIVVLNGKEVGSSLISQKFTKDKYFISRPSFVNYNESYNNEPVNATSGSQNLGPTSSELKENTKNNINEFLRKNKEVKKEDISEELISQSGSGLDPDITINGALIQIPRISKNTGISEEKLKELVLNNKKGKFLGMYGEERVNVLGLNIEIDKLIG